MPAVGALPLTAGAPPVLEPAMLLPPLPLAPVSAPALPTTPFASGTVFS